MKNSLRLSIAALAALGVGSVSYRPAAAQITKTPAGYKMRIKFVKGQTLRYVMSMRTSAPGQGSPRTMSMPMTMTVTGVNKGVGTIRYTTGPIKGISAKPNVSTVQMDSMGKIISGSENTMGFTGASLPSGPVKIGQSWTRTTPVPLPTGKMNVMATYRLNGVMSVGGTQVADLSVKMSGSSSSLSLNATGKMQLSLADGQLSMANIAQRMRINQGQKPINLTVNVSIKKQ